MTAAGRKYLSEVKKRVLSRGDERTKYLNAMENRTIEYTQSHPDATVEELCRELGDFRSIGQQQIDDCPSERIHFLARGGKIALKGLLILFITTILTLALTVAYIAIDNNNIQNGYEEEHIYEFE